VTAAQRQAWERAREQLQQTFKAVEQAFGRQVSAELRDVRRDVARLDRKLSPK
jgi:predicted phage gp36 major capsid-like protein